MYIGSHYAEAYDPELHGIIIKYLFIKKTKNKA